MPSSTEKIQWHPAFYDAIKAELDEYSSCLSFIPERQLTAEPLRMDLLVIKKLSDIQIDKNIGRIFQRNNILEYKAPGDSLTVDGYNKVFGYAYLYAYLEKLDIHEITVTFVVSARPDNVLSYLGARAGISIEPLAGGIYYIHNEIMPVQIIITKFLPPDENIWLVSLTDNIKGEQLEKVIVEKENLSIEIGALIYAIALANPEVLKEESDKMGQTLEAVLDEIGFVDKKVLQTERKEAFEKIARFAAETEVAKMDTERFKKEKTKAEADKARIEAEMARVEEKNARIEAEKARIEAEKARIEAEKARIEAEKDNAEAKITHIEEEYADIRKNLVEAAFDMLYRGAPPALVSKWTALPEDVILRLKSEMDITTSNTISFHDDIWSAPNPNNS